MNKQKKKLPLAMQIFIALVLAIVVGLANAESGSLCGELY